MASTHAPTANEYVTHHLTHLSNAKQTGMVDWSVIHLDSIFFSILLGLITVFLLARAAARATAGVPGRFQAAVEILVEMVADQAKALVHSPQSRKFVAPLALTVFIWVFLMNFMDLVPVDLLPTMAAGVGIGYLRAVPTADINITLGMSAAVLLLCLYYNVKIKGLGHWLHELFTAPFGNHFLLWPFNFVMQIIEFASKTISHGMRLFGNLYAGKLIFFLIALMGGAWDGSVGGVMLWIGHLFAGAAWAIFHILIIVLQAFIFMMLTLVYIGQAHESH